MSSTPQFRDILKEYLNNLPPNEDGFRPAGQDFFDLISLLLEIYGFSLLMHVIASVCEEKTEHFREMNNSLLFEKWKLFKTSTRYCASLT